MAEHLEAKRATDSPPERPSTPVEAVPSWVVELLACPVDYAPVRLEGDRIICILCERRYAVHDGIPVMIADQLSEQTF